MSIALWVVQGLLAWLAVAGGYFQLFKINDLKTTVVAMQHLPQGLWAVLGVVGIVAGIGLVVPAVFKDLPMVALICAAVMLVHSLLIAGFYLYFGDKAPLPYVLFMALLAAVILFGRLKLAA
ncbi:DoxX family protein [Saccharospirillum mangrovi]|uniref:DoxX family protein n=1 Tax=Saccharospirillum mangrovi TaxID=2161747 RepID=UPI000D3B4542|nr:DoxX family protein [Saccharospirillum mangrovi]